MPKKRKFSKPAVCVSCAGTHMVRRITTFPVNLTTGPLKGKQIEVGRVPLYQCQTCGHLMPTAAGLAKVDDLVKRTEQFFGTLG